MNLDNILTTLGETALRESLATHWEAAQSRLPPDRPVFLRHESIRTAWEYGSFPLPLPDDVLRMADRMAADPALLRLAWYACWRICEGPRDKLQWSWPGLQAYLGEDAGLFYLVVALAFVPAVRAYHATLQLPEAITRDTCRQVSGFLLNYQRGHSGRPGVYTSQFGWLANYLAPNLYFRIGRFEYWLRPCGSDFRLYRHVTTGAVMALAPGQATFTAEGTRCFAAHEPNPPGSWQSVFTQTAAGVTGNPVTPAGVALPDPVHLPHAAWTCVLQQDDTVLDLHIPAGGGMTLEACAQSFRAAADFFRTRFPDRQPRAIASVSWMFSGQLEDALPPDANLARLVRELYLVPAPCRPNDGLWFVFLQTPFDPATAPRETRLQRDILDYLGKGHAWRQAGMFLLLDDLPRFGTQFYRRQCSSIS
jgi:hypothetical protein